ncbi:MAG: hypothetical protein N2556_04175, partial [Anaerolineae bacterium]|nr:hypothetical protein [Anaerolineae bacterium]
MSEAHPRYVNIPLEVVNHRGLTDPLFRTYVQLRGLAWEKEYRETPALRGEELREWLGCSERSLRGHLAALEGLGLIEVRRRAGRLVIRFLEGKGVDEASEGSAEEGEALRGERQGLAGGGKDLPESAEFCRDGQRFAGVEEAEERQSFAGSGKDLPESAEFCRNRQRFAGSAAVVVAVMDTESELDRDNNSSNNNSNIGRQRFSGRRAVRVSERGSGGLPEGLREKLRRIGFSGMGPMRELEAAWRAEPERVEGWVEYVLG